MNNLFKQCNFNPNMLTIAREARGFTQSQLSKVSNISQGNLSKIEQGLIEPTEEVLDRLAVQLGYPKEFFEEKISLLPVNHMFHRKRKSIGKKVLSNIDSNLAIKGLHITKLLSSLKISDDIPRLGVEDYGNPEIIARKLRLYWKIPQGPIKNLTGLLESKGAIIVDVATSDKLDGMAVPNTEDIPIIYLNQNKPIDRRRFTLSHELGHIVMHTNYIPSLDDDVEDEADRFASEFLVPSQEFKSMCVGKYITIEELGFLKKYWRVSMASLLRKLNTLNLITPQRYRSLNVEISRLGYRKHEPDFGIPEEESRLLRFLVDQYIKKLEYTEKQLADLLRLTIDEFREMYRVNNLKLQYSKKS
ncbi:Zn-dependent peptidase ImmA (M78 family) [Neolewinella xylanilytica]|uniref:Zn-dependent peptidase ImmA (M78 family) n=1 Tax=Neolewinella xylanilytica TaxID=1514080 RepID=A0A2S6I6D4_9BACT|nr:XRE family transcriptional regulator [Neolewinella xylanilytica]PPK86734.1 Zn-dependent peptidase ImmA (M78 family) [Neolewinella xylanilytica]